MVEVLLPYLVLLARTVPLVELTPFLGAMPVPRVVKLALALGLAAVLWPVAPVVTTTNIAALLVTEAAVGLTLGFLGSLVFEAARMAGSLVDRSVAPRGDEGPFERAYALLAVCVFMLIGGHQVWIDAIAHSYVFFPPGLASMTAGGALELGRAASGAVSLALLLALPAVATAAVVEVVLAVLRRSSPALEPLLTTGPLRVLAVTAVAALGLGVFAAELNGAAVDAIASFETLAEASDVR